jgi:hypothetical protein
MITATRVARATVLCAAATAFLLTPIGAAQGPIDVYELADYRLTTEVFEKFARASHRVGDITGSDASFTFAPLFTKDVVLSGDAVAEAAGLIARLENHKGLAAALDDAQITPREYAKFAITLIAAHLAEGFLAAGVLPRVPAGAPTVNVEFVKAHGSEVAVALASLGIRD